MSFFSNVLGPKYILKLQQEVTAMRVMISMDTHSHVDGASKVHTIKRYLSEHKDESIINTSSMRCREIDCLRAYYYVAIINFLQESCFSGEVNEAVKFESDNSSLPSEAKRDETVSNECEIATDENKCAKTENESAENNQNEMEKRLSPEATGITESSCITKNMDDNSKQSEKETSENVCDKTDAGQDKADCKTSDNSTTVTTDNSKPEANSENKEAESAVPLKNSSESAGPLKNSSESAVPLKNEAESSVPLSQPSSSSSLSSSSSQSKDSKPTALEKKDIQENNQTVDKNSDNVVSKQTCQMVPVFNLNHYLITVARLSQLSQGLLWDIQAKRFALTETLGYIHKAISQLLLSKNSQSSEIQTEVDNETKETKTDESTEQDGRCESSGTFTNGEIGLDKKMDKHFGSLPNIDQIEKEGIAMATGNFYMKEGHVLSHEVHSCEHHLHEHHLHESNSEGHICPTVLSHHFDQMLNIHVPHVGEVPINSCQGDQDSGDPKCNFFDVCSSCELLHKSRKILFDDEPRLHTRPEVGFKDMTNIRNPAKYINVPDEWYSMPVDQKYFKRYITMAILKDEQEYVMGELKRGPDGTQVSWVGFHVIKDLSSILILIVVDQIFE